MTTKITIGDVGTSSCVELGDKNLKLVYSGGCPVLKILSPLGLSETMSVDDIEDRVYKAWTEDYEGDPGQNELTVTVERIPDEVKP